MFPLSRPVANLILPFACLSASLNIVNLFTFSFFFCKKRNDLVAFLVASFIQMFSCFYSISNMAFKVLSLIQFLLDLLHHGLWTPPLVFHVKTWRIQHVPAKKSGTTIVQSVCQAIAAESLSPKTTMVTKVADDLRLWMLVLPVLRWMLSCAMLNNVPIVHGRPAYVIGPVIDDVSMKFSRNPAKRFTGSISTQKLKSLRKCNENFCILRNNSNAWYIFSLIKAEINA